MSCNKLFLKHLKVVIISAKSYASNPIHLFLGVKNSEVGDFFQNELNGLIDNNFQFQIIIYPPTFLDAVILRSVSPLPVESRYRLLLGSSLPFFVKKVLYLDTDLIISDDLSKIFFQELKTCIGGVKDFYSFSHSKNRIMKLWYKLEKYINSGVLLINLEKWREFQSENKIIHLLSQEIEQLRFVDQDTINIIFRHEITYLEAKWNHTIYYGYENPDISPTVSIYHIIWPRKGDSILYPSLKIRKLFFIFSSYPHIPTRPNFLDEIVFYTMAYPLSIFMFFKGKILYRFYKIHFLDFFVLVLLLHPLVLWEFFKEIYFRYKRWWILSILNRIKDFWYISPRNDKQI